MITPSDFTIMISNIKIDDNDEKIKNYLYDELEVHDLPPCRVIKINKATFRSNVDKTQFEIIESDKYIDSLKQVLSHPDAIFNKK